MKKSKRQLFNKVLSWFLTLVMLVGIFCGQGTIASASGIDPTIPGTTVGNEVIITVKDSNDSPIQNDDGISLEIQSVDQQTTRVSATYIGNSQFKCELPSSSSQQYKYELKATYYESASGTFSVSTDNNTAEIKAEKFTPFVSGEFSVKNDIGKIVPGASVTVTDVSSTPVNPGSEGKYRLTSQAVYNYTVSAADYETATGRFKANDVGPQTIDVTLKSKTKPITFSVTSDSDSARPLEGAEITITNTSGTVQTLTTENSGQASFNAGVAYQYTYSVSLEGYGTISNQSLDLNDADSIIDIKMSFNAITLNPSGEGTYEPGDTFTLKVKDPVAGAKYTWKTSDTKIAELSATEGKSVGVTTGKTNKDSPETAIITVSCEGKTATYTVKVNRKVSSDANFTVKYLGTESPEGDNATGVQLIYSGLDSSANGTVVTFSWKDADNSTLSYSVNVMNGQATLDITEETNPGIVELLQKGVDFKAVYSGNHIFADVAEKSVHVQCLQTKDLKFSENFITDPDGDPELENAYWGKDEDGLDILYVDFDAFMKDGIKLLFDEESLTTDSFLSYTIDQANADVLTIDDATNIVTLSKLGETSVTIKRSKDTTNGWLEASKTFKVVVTKTISVEDLTWSAHQTVEYKGQKDQIFDMKGTYTNSVISDLPLEINVKAVTAAVSDEDIVSEVDANAGKYAYMLIVDADNAADGINIVSSNAYGTENASTYYRFDETSLSGEDLAIKLNDGSSIIEITKIELSVEVYNKNSTDGSFQYPKDIKDSIDKAIVNDGGIRLKTGEGSKIINSGNNIGDTNIVNNAVANVKVIAPSAGEYNVKTYENIIKPDLEAVNSGLTNYVLVCADTDFADLTIGQYNVENTPISELVTISGDNYVIWENEDVAAIWLKGARENNDGQKTGGNLILTPNQTSDKFSEYEEVYLVKDGGTPQLVSNDTGFVWDLNEGVEKNSSFTFYLQDGNDPNTKTTEKTIVIYADSDAPVVTFDDAKTVTHPIDSVLETISFGMYSNEQYELSFSVTDREGSGIASTSIHKWHLNESQAGDGTVTAETINAYIEELNDSEDWISCNNTDGSVEFPVGDADAYLVLVKTTDNVGNTKIYASNGIIIEKVTPSLQITGLSDAIYNKDSEISYTITAVDGIFEDVQTGDTLGISGIKRIETEVLYNGKSLDEEHRNFYVNPQTGKLEEMTEEDYNNLLTTSTTTSALDQASYDLPMTLDVKYDSNDIVIRVTAYDRAGNFVITSKAIKVDRHVPVIDVKYDNNAVVNGIYFQNARTAIITFTERNFDPAKVRFNLTLESGGEYTNMTLDQLNSISGITASWGTDSQGDYEPEKYTDSRTNIATVVFSGDNAYSNFIVSCTDNAGNVNETVNYDSSTAQGTESTFVIDNIDPVISVKYYADGQLITPGKAESARLYKNKTIDAVITVTEHNFVNGDTFVDNQITYTVTASKVNQDTGTVPDYQQQANTVSNWTSVADTRTCTNFVYAVDGNYITSFTYTDLSGRTATWSNDYFTVDKTVPTGQITIKEGDTIRDQLNQFLEAISFGLYTNRSLQVSMTSSDYTSPLVPDRYYKAYTAMDLNSVQNIPDASWTVGNSFSVATDEQFVPYMKIEDLAGNVTYISSSTIAVVDQTNPLNADSAKPIITITASEPSHGIYNGDVPFHIHVEDPEAGGTYSGLSYVTYEIIKDGQSTPTQSNTYRFDADPRTQYMDRDEVISANLNNSNDVMIRVTAVDNAGNEISETKEVKIDITEPTISIVFNNNSLLNGNYYNDTRTATVTVTERNFDESAFRFSITNTDGIQPAISGWSHSANSGVLDSATHTCTVTFAADGDYTMSAVCTDLAGNSAQGVEVPGFTIDKTLPTVNVTYSNNDALNGHFYNESRTATVTITEHNFRASDARATITAALNGAGISAPSISGWSTSGDRHTATISFSSDGDYTFDIAYTDLAGNAMADYAQDSFTVDLTNPEIEITGVENRSANKGTVAPVITLTDTNYTANGVTLTLTGADKGRINVDAMVSRSAVTNGQTITFRNFGENMDDIYTLTAKLVDQAGNETTRSITFSVNRDGSTYKLDDYAAQLVQSGFTNSPKDIVIQEVNVDTLEFIEITYTKDGEVVTLKEGVDYTVEEEGGDGQWKVYTYTIKASCFEEEGQYSINIYSEDRAKNTSTYQAKNSKLDEEEQMTLEFVVDKTAPSVSIANLEDRGRYRENVHEFTLSVKDNMLLSYVELYLDGVLYHTYSGDELTVEDGVLTIPVDSKNAYQTVKIIAYDAAGNPTDPVEYQVLVTSNWWIQFYMNKPLFFGCIAGIVVIAGVIIFLVVKRSKKDNKNYKKI